jgi:hypothetical protein
MRQISDTMAELRGGGTGNDTGEQEGEGYKWSQDGDDLEISIEVDDAVNKKDLKINFGQEKVSVIVKGEKKVDLMLFDKIRPDECNWTVGKGKVYVYTHAQRLFSLFFFRYLSLVICVGTSHSFPLTSSLIPFLTPSPFLLCSDHSHNGETSIWLVAKPSQMEGLTTHGWQTT